MVISINFVKTGGMSSNFIFHLKKHLLSHNHGQKGELKNRFGKRKKEYGDTSNCIIPHFLILEKSTSKVLIKKVVTLAGF